MWSPFKKKSIVIETPEGVEDPNNRVLTMSLHEFVMGDLANRHDPTSYSYRRCPFDYGKLESPRATSAQEALTTLSQKLLDDEERNPLRNGRDLVAFDPQLHQETTYFFGFKVPSSEEFYWTAQLYEYGWWAPGD